MMVVLAALPALGMTGFAVYDSSNVSQPRGFVAATVGDGSAGLVRVVSADPVAQTRVGDGFDYLEGVSSASASDFEAAIVAELPQAAHVIAAERTTAAVSAGELVTEPLLVEQSDLHAHPAVLPNRIRGAMPADAHQVALSNATARRLNLQVGDTVALIRDDDRVQLEVVGIVSDGLSTQPQAFVGPSSIPASWFASFPGGNSDYVWYVAGPGSLGWDAVKALNALGATVTAPALATSEPPAALPLSAGDGGGLLTGLPTWIRAAVPAAAAALLYVLLAPMFAIRSSRSGREVALLWAIGGDGRTVRATLISLAAIVGAAGGIVGAGLALIAASVATRVALLPTVARVLVPAGDVAFVVLLTVLFCVVACYTSARRASAMPVARALATGAGEVETAPLRATRVVARSVPFAGGLIVAASGALLGVPALSAIGVVAGVVGIVMSVPTIVALTAAAPWPLALRLGFRDAARQPRRTRPAVALVALACLLLCASAFYVTANAAAAAARYVPRTSMGYSTVAFVPIPGAAAKNATDVVDQAVQAAADQLGRGPVALIHVATAPPVDGQFVGEGGISFSGESFATMIDLTQVQVYSHDNAQFLGFSDQEALRKAVASDAVVVSEPDLISSTGTVTLSDGDTSVTVPGAYVPAPENSFVVAVPADVPAEVGLETRVGTAVFAGPAPRTQTTDALRSAAMSQTGSTMSVVAYTERGYQNVEQRPLMVASLLVAALAVLASWLVAALAAVEQRADLIKLAAVGSRSRTVRGIAATQSTIVALLGGVLGVAGASLLMVLFIEAQHRSDQYWHLIVPWPTITLAMIGVPAVCALGALAVTRPPRRLVPTRSL